MNQSVVFLTSKNNGKADSAARAALRAAGINIAEQLKGGHKLPAISVGSSTYVGLVPIGRFIRTVQGES